MLTIVVFGSSLALSILLLAVKALEIRSSNKNFFLRLVCKLDERSASLISGIKFRALQLIQTVRYIFLVRIKEIILESVARLQERMMLEYRIRQEVIMGKKNIARKGSVSFYLKKITEEKDFVGRGKIEESL